MVTRRVVSVCVALVVLAAQTLTMRRSSKPTFQQAITFATQRPGR